MVDLLFSVGEFDYLTITAAYESETISVVASCLALHGVIDIYLHNTKEMVEEDLRTLLDSYMGRELTIICVHHPTQEVCGGLFSNAINSDITEVCSGNNTVVMKPLNDFLEEIDQNFFRNSGFSPKQCLHQHIIGVNTKWAGNKIGENLVLGSMQVGKAKGLLYALIELAGPATQHICINICKYMPYQEIVYRDYEYNGVKYFENLEGSCVLAVKEFS